LGSSEKFYGCIKDIDKYHVANTTHNHRPERERGIYLEDPVAFPNFIGHFLIVSESVPSADLRRPC
jgi:hypothetical protein